MQKNFIVVASVLALAGLSMTACSSPGQAHDEAEDQAVTASPETGFMTAAELPDEYVRAIDRFPNELPEGVDWASAEDYVPGEAEGVFEDGFLDMSVTEYWLCAWIGEYVEADDSSDEAGKSTAMAKLDEYTGLPAVVAYHQNPQDFRKSVLDSAKLGDTENIRKFDNFCGDMVVKTN